VLPSDSTVFCCKQTIPDSQRNTIIHTRVVCSAKRKRQTHRIIYSKALCSTTPPARVRKMAERLIKSAIQQIIPDQRTETVIQLTTLVTLLLQTKMNKFIIKLNQPQRTSSFLVRRSQSSAEEIDKQ
jgi:hypothetical protein